MNFDINQDLSSLQKVRNPRNRRIRPDKGKAKGSAAAPSQPTADPAVLPAEAQPSPQVARTFADPHAPVASSCPVAVEQQATPAAAADPAATRQSYLQTQPDLLSASLHVRHPDETCEEVAPLATAQEDAGTGISTGLLPEQYQAADFRQGHASTGPSSWKGSPHVAIPEPAASDAVADLRAEHPESCEPPGIDQLPQNKRRRAPTRRKPLPELGTNISKSAVKPRKKARQKTTNALVPQSASVEHDCSTAMVACEADVDHADQPMAVSNSVVNQYDEMTRALCAGKRHKGKRKKIDPAAPIDPKNMTLMDVIRHAHSNANILDRQYKEKKANEQKEKENAIASPSDALPASPAEDEAGPSTDRAPLAPQLVLRDGKIVIDEDSLRVQATGPVGLRRVQVEDDDDTLINSHSYLPVSKLTKERWTRQETDLFYQILTNFGADFTFMAQCFQGRTRKQVKNKYLKEQKVDPARVREAMSGRQTATLAQLTSLAQPGTAAAGIVAMLPGGDNAVGENSVMAEELDDAEGDDEYLSVNPIANEFYY